jgi:hypothetical protein
MLERNGTARSNVKFDALHFNGAFLSFFPRQSLAPQAKSSLLFES